MKTILAVLMLAALALCESAPQKAAFQEATNTANFYIGQVLKNMDQATPKIEVLSGTAQSSLASTSEQLKNAQKASSQTQEVPMGLSESEAKELTQIQSIAKNLKSQIATLTASAPTNALDENAESSLIAAAEKMKMSLQANQNPASTPVPTIPSQVTSDLSSIHASSKAFKKLPQKKAAAKASQTSLRARAVLAGTGDLSGAGDRKAAASKGKAPVSNEISIALQRVNNALKKPSHANEVEIGLFNHNKEYAKLAQQMKDIQVALEHIPSAAEAEKIAKNQVTARKNAEAELAVKKPSAVKLSGMTHADISSAKVKMMLDFVKDLDELGRFFGEDELVEEDDTLSIVEDPKINIANSNFDAAVHRIRADLKANPNMFAPDYKLRDVAHHLENPVPVQHYAPSDETDNLSYLRNLRNYVVSLRENEKSL